jgi:hypothetical protein
VADQKIDFTALRPAKSKPMSADLNFQASRSRFAVEPLFFYYNVRVQDRMEEEQRKKWRAEAEAEAAKTKVTERKRTEPGDEPQTTEREGKIVATAPAIEITEAMKDGSSATTTPSDVNVEVAPSPEPSPSPTPTPNPSAQAFSKVMDSIFSMIPVWPDAVSGAVAFEGDDTRLSGNQDRAANLDKGGGACASRLRHLHKPVTGPADDFRCGLDSAQKTEPIEL